MLRAWCLVLCRVPGAWCSTPVLVDVAQAFRPAGQAI